MEKSILKSTKKILGLGAEYTPFDLDVLTWINSACADLLRLGVGPQDLYVEDDELEWDAFEQSVEDTNLIKTYIFLSVKMMFDPPQAGHVMAAMQEQLKKQEFLLSVNREDRDWRPEEVTRER